MKIEFKIPGATHRETFEALGMMLDVIGRQSTLNDTVCFAMDADEENLAEHINVTYIQNDFQVEFNYYKSTGKISLSSRRVK